MPISTSYRRFDLGIRLGELLDQDVTAFPLQAPIRQIACASPGYVAVHGMPSHPRDLREHRCIGFRWPGHDTLYGWDFCEEGTWFSIPITGPLTFNDQRAALDAAIGGVGIAFWVESEIRRHIDEGRLVAMLTDYSAPFPGFALYYLRHRQRSAAVTALIGMIRQQVAAVPIIPPPTNAPY
ncbi:LysR substrate-binding domain-containing protein [Sphingomonas nostoxanthinifaciens]|uniref:LysR substrate-binding domain-containing protein n=1 Tax=Sphingomonas nostoxanthinifaciens TaxID=2872652 RepID=UPI001CC207D9|nr:LysR substrate-binding domain-containing protein [Sphingomonas nostoxanthinifaciens]UAK25609.1 hypothetical protein K8P63_05520 [Sphingomonas nostoxanthinifaciens]